MRYVNDTRWQWGSTEMEETTYMTEEEFHEAWAASRGGSVILDEGPFLRGLGHKDFRLTNYQGEEFYLDDDEVESLVEQLEDMNKLQEIMENRCSDCDRCAGCSMCEGCDRQSPDNIAEWIKDNVDDMAKAIVEEIVSQKSFDIDMIAQELFEYAKRNVCFLKWLL